MFDDDVTVPAGWYPDPMGLPQLRWWNNHAWTELTTEARPPLVMQQPTKLLYADEELPTRRQQREQRERDEQYVRLATVDELETESGGDRAGLNGDSAPFADPGREIDSRADAEAATFTPMAEPAAKTLPEDFFEAGEDVGEGYTPRSATTAVSAPTAQNAQGTMSDADAVEAKRTAVSSRLPIYTAPVWVIALLPLGQLVVSLLLLLGFGSSLGVGITAAIWILPYLVIIVLAFADRLMLKRAGHEHTAHWAWAILTAPIYLVARSAALSRSGHLGLAPLMVWVALGLLQVGSILVVPGMLISAVPTVFAQQAEQSIASDASIIGATLTVTCPANPPVLMDQQFTCAAKSSAGESYNVTASLERVNGWIDWRVDDWGIYSLSR